MTQLTDKVTTMTETSVCMCGLLFLRGSTSLLFELSMILREKHQIWGYNSSIRELVMVLNEDDRFIGCIANDVNAVHKLDLIPNAVLDESI